MKVLIPMSGGVNSTYALWRWLKESDHEIVSIFFKEYGYELYSVEELAVMRVKEWLEKNTRSFTLLPPISRQTYYDYRPIRKGFRHLTNYGNLIDRFENMADVLVKENCDAIVYGYSLENTSTDCYWAIKSILERTGKKVYWGSTVIRELEIPKEWAFPEPEDTGTFIETISGRWEQLEALPEELRSLVVTCSGPAGKQATPLPHPTSECWHCAVMEAYETSGMSGYEFDQWLAERIFAGKWRPNADPQSTTYRNSGIRPKSPNHILHEMKQSLKCPTF
tara:strand:- start:138 stop:974 length:837 start_codon:yes stop_codon:yes gene_type:complete